MQTNAQRYETGEMARSLMPTMENENKATYLSWIVCNFSVREAVKLTGIHQKTVTRWREADPEFVELEQEGLTNRRKQMANEFLDMQFTRNFRLILQKDFDVLYKDATKIVLTEFEQAYLLKVRQHYTPQSLAMLKQLLAGGNIQQPFDFTKLTMTISREREQIKVEGENIG